MSIVKTLRFPAPAEWRGGRRVELDVELEVDPGHEAAALRAAELVEHHCLVGPTLDVPVRVRAAAVPPRRLAVAS